MAWLGKARGSQAMPEELRMLGSEWRDLEGKESVEGHFRDMQRGRRD